MATPIPYKYYKKQVNQEWYPERNLASVSYSDPNIVAITPEEFKSLTQSWLDRPDLSKWSSQQIQDYKASGMPTTYAEPQRRQTYQSWIDDLASGAPTGQFLTPEGMVMDQAKLDWTAQQKAGVAAGTTKEVQFPGGAGYVPTGSPADILSSQGQEAYYQKYPEQKPATPTFQTSYGAGFDPNKQLRDVAGNVYDKFHGEAFQGTYPTANKTIGDLIAQQAQGGVSDLAQSMASSQQAPQAPAGSYSAQFQGLQEKAGIPQMKAQIGTFDEEIKKGNDLLADLTQRIRGGMSKEQARKAPMELITGRQEELERDASLTRNDLLDLIKSSQTGRSQLLDTMGRERQDILDILDMREKDEELGQDEQERIETDVERKKELIAQGYTDIGLNDTWELIGQKIATKEGQAPKDTELVEAGNRVLLINSKTGEVIKDLGVADVNPYGGSVSERMSSAEQTYINDASQKLIADKTSGGWQNVDGNRYMELRRNFPGDPSRFDEKLSYLLSDKDVERYSIGRWKETSSTSSSDVPQWQYELGVRPNMNTSERDAILNQNKTVTDQMRQIETIFQQYKDADWSKTDAKNKFKQENNLESIPAAIDDIFNRIWGGWF